MRPVLGAVCHRLIVVSNCMPGSAHSHAACEIWRMSSRACTVSIGSPVVTAVEVPVGSSTTACMNVVGDAHRVVRVLVLDRVASRCRRGPCRSRRRASARALRSSLALHQMNSSMSGWSTLRMTILAARRVLPPDLIVPADASAPRMKLTGPLAVPPPLRCSFDERMFERLMPEPEPPLKIVPSSRYQLRIAVHRVLDREDEARERLLRHALHADVEPHRRVERGALGDEHVLELVAERRALLRRRRSSRRARPTTVIVSATRSITWRSDVSRSAVPSVPRKYFWATMLVAFCDHVDRELDVGLEEGVGAVLVVRDPRLAPLPLDGVVGVHARAR